MRAIWAILAGLAVLPISAESRVEPKASSIHPFIGQQGTTFLVTVRGSGLAGTTGVSLGKAPFTVAVEGQETEKPGESAGPAKRPIDLVKLRVQALPDAKPGRYPIRLITKNGVSNALPIQIVDLPVAVEPEGAHDGRQSAVAVSKVPVAYAGRLSQRGETDYYSFHADAGQTITFELISGLPQIAAGGSAATIANFDPALTIYEPSGSWFDPGRLNRIAYNDEPEWVFGRPTDAYLVQKFDRSGEYLARVEAFAGQGGPDYSYELRIAPGVHPQSNERRAGGGWAERTWTRKLTGERLLELDKRGGKDATRPAIETYRAAAEAVPFKLPGTLEGALAQPGETHRARFHLDQPSDIAIEVQTPNAGPPYFNPIVRVIGPSGEEFASNVLAGKGACTGAMTKSIQPKTMLPLRDTGDYTIEIREATADLAGADYQYRVLVRPQVPHIGDVKVATDVVNLAQGQADTIRVIFDREEDFRGAVAVSAEGLPDGVSAVAAADFEPDKDKVKIGKPERYLGRTERIVVALSARADAPVTNVPREARLVVRPIVDGKPGEPVFTKTIPMMVLPKP